MKNILNERIPKQAIGIWWIGQGGFIFKTSKNKIIIVDPYLSDSTRYDRLTAIPVKPANITADFLLCTHDHWDHTDPDTLSQTKQVGIFMGPSSVIGHYKKLGIPEEKIIKINTGESSAFGDIKILAVFAKHTGDSVGYILNLEGITIYITGDTEYDEKLKEVNKFKPDIMLVCINGKLGNMNIEEAALLTRAIDPEIVIPMHYGMFEENTADPKDFINCLEKLSFKGEKKILETNKFFLYKKKEAK